MQYSSIKVGIQRSIDSLRFNGKRVESKSWQSIQGDFDTWELLNHTLNAPIPPPNLLVNECKPNLPWADDHFLERVSGIPLNPPPSSEYWPYAQKNNEAFKRDEKFDHTYPERMWPKFTKLQQPFRKDVTPEEFGIKANWGIRYGFGDLNDLVELLKKDPDTRQAYLPIFFPEDTGAVMNQRIPCTLGYHFIKRHGFLHMTYYIRSCDIIRHFQDDIYLALRLFYWVRAQANLKAIPGQFTMHIVSLHCFFQERMILKG